MTDFCRSWLRSIQLVSAFALCACAQSPEEIRQLSLEISTSASYFVAGAEIDVSLDVSNHSDQDIVIFTGLRAPERGGFEFLVSRSDSPLFSKLRMTSYLWRVLGRRAAKENVKDPDELSVLVSGGGAATRIAPGTTIRFSTVLNNLYDLTAPGTYTIHVRKATGNGDATAAVESNAITVTVTEPPPPAVSMELTTNAQQFSAGSQIDADLAVTNISNAPITLPFDPDRPSAEENGFKFTGFVQRKSSNNAVRLTHEYWWKGFNYQYPSQKTVQPGQTIHYSVPLSNVLDVRASGAYTIEAKGVDPVTHLSVESNPLQIAVQ